jgi:hypothetical protein
MWFGFSCTAQNIAAAHECTNENPAAAGLMLFAGCPASHTTLQEVVLSLMIPTMTMMNQMMGVKQSRM